MDCECAVGLYRSVHVNLRRYHGIAIDVGDQDGLRVDTGKLHDALDRYARSHSRCAFLHHNRAGLDRQVAQPGKKGSDVHIGQVTTQQKDVNFL
jgi:hypothetical protein